MGYDEPTASTREMLEAGGFVRLPGPGWEASMWEDPHTGERVTTTDALRRLEVYDMTRDVLQFPTAEQADDAMMDLADLVDGEWDEDQAAHDVWVLQGFALGNHRCPPCPCPTTLPRPTGSIKENLRAVATRLQEGKAAGKGKLDIQQLIATIIALLTALFGGGASPTPARSTQKPPSGS